MVRSFPQYLQLDFWVINDEQPQSKQTKISRNIKIFGLCTLLSLGKWILTLSG
jgi:hypothetical protein